ncbi:hypothetical protein [Dysgonomonas gadei]|uniref:Uncharacterized protein n=1 Tax=Dysgonomonas gadei ATCC BAA-286 TaxID=742766 RepID=F5IXN4_9BACT|nr:hypothetical protein [Dysgonomonas gadei]EGK01703.1 hypothetical protein HMPREF9455_01851 [Dysgonomonas gadei ATCC BAA-286]
MKGICFIEPLHGKTVKNIKVQTRRIITPQPLDIVCSTIIDNKLLFATRDENDASVFIEPRYKVGDVLYLKEPYKKWTRGLSEGRHTSILYKYGEETPCDKVGTEGNSYYTDWKNKLFMPASAARHFIKITEVRAERLQDITEEDCKKEGIIDVEFYPDEGFPLNIGILIMMMGKAYYTRPVKNLTKLLSIPLMAKILGIITLGCGCMIIN